MFYWQIALFKVMFLFHMFTFSSNIFLLSLNLNLAPTLYTGTSATLNAFTTLQVEQFQIPNMLSAMTGLPGVQLFMC